MNVAVACERVRSRWTRELLFPLLLVAGYAVLVAISARVGTQEAPVPAVPAVNLLDKPLGEDAFYMLSVARRLGHGEFMRYGDVPTTGTQPLTTLLYGSIYACTEALGAGPFLPLRIIIVLDVFFLVGTAVTAGEIVRRWATRQELSESDARWAASFVGMVVALNPGAFRQYAYGLETGLYLFLMSLVLLYLDVSQVLEQPRPGAGYPVVVAGGLIGLTILTRIDFVVICLVALLPAFLRRGGRRWRAASIAAIAGLIALPWFAYVYSVVGGIMPSSGGAQSGAVVSWSALADRASAAAAALVVASSAVLYFPSRFGIAHLGVLAVVGGLVVVLRRPLLRLAREVGNWFAGAAVLCVTYVLFFSSGHFYSRYFSPLWLLWTLVLAGAAAIALTRRSSPSRGRWFLGTFLGLAMLFGIQLGYTLHRGHVSNTHLYSAFYVQQHGTSLGRVGAFQSGLIGYLNDGTINLDGKVDGNALKWGRAGRLECYLQERKISAVIDWPEAFRGGWISPGFVARSMRFRDAVPGGNSVVMTVEASTEPCL